MREGDPVGVPIGGRARQKPGLLSHLVPYPAPARLRALPGLVLHRLRTATRCTAYQPGADGRLHSACACLSVLAKGTILRYNG